MSTQLYAPCRSDVKIPPKFSPKKLRAASVQRDSAISKNVINGSTLLTAKPDVGWDCTHQYTRQALPSDQKSDQPKDSAQRLSY